MIIYKRDTGRNEKLKINLRIRTRNLSHMKQESNAPATFFKMILQGRSMKRDYSCCKCEEKYSSNVTRIQFKLKSVPGWFQWFYMVFASPSEKVEVVSDKEVFNEQFRSLKKTFRQALTTTVECLKRMPLRGIPQDSILGDGVQTHQQSSKGCFSPIKC